MTTACAELLNRIVGNRPAFARVPLRPGNWTTRTWEFNVWRTARRALAAGWGFDAGELPVDFAVDHGGPIPGPIRSRQFWQIDIELGPMFIILAEARVAVFAQCDISFAGSALVSVLRGPLSEIKDERLFPVMSGLAVAIADDRIPLERIAPPRRANALRRLRGDPPIPAIWRVDASSSLNPVGRDAHLTRDGRFFRGRRHG